MAQRGFRRREGNRVLRTGKRVHNARIKLLKPTVFFDRITLITEKKANKSLSFGLHKIQDT